MNAAGSKLMLPLVAALAIAANRTSLGSNVLFRDITAESGITFTHHAAPEKKYIVESMSGGVAMFDYDNDGLIDLYFVDSLTVETAHKPETARSALYKNLGNGRFADVTEKSGLAHPGWGMAGADVDIVTLRCVAQVSRHRVLSGWQVRRRVRIRGENRQLTAA